MSWRIPHTAMLVKPGYARVRITMPTESTARQLIEYARGSPINLNGNKIDFKSDCSMRQKFLRKLAGLIRNNITVPEGLTLGNVLTNRCCIHILN